MLVIAEEITFPKITGNIIKNKKQTQIQQHNNLSLSLSSGGTNSS